MSIRTYAVNCNDAWLNTEGDDISGSYVKYKDHQDVVADLEAKCAALAAELKQSQIDAGCYKHGMEASNSRLVQVAAENAALKSAHPQPFGPQMMKALDAYEKYQDEVPETGMLDAFFILRDSIRVETPATDAFLAEVRAQGVEMFSNAIGVSYQKLKPGSAQAKALKNVVFLAVHFAAQLRQEAAQ